MVNIVASGIGDVAKFDFKKFATKNSTRGEDKFLVLGNEMRSGVSTAKVILGTMEQSELPIFGRSVQSMQPMVNPEYQNEPIYQNDPSVVYSSNEDSNKEVWNLFRNYIADRYSQDTSSVYSAFKEVDEEASSGKPLSLRKASQIMQDIEDSQHIYKSPVHTYESIDDLQLVGRGRSGSGEHIQPTSEEEGLYEPMKNLTFSGSDNDIQPTSKEEGPYESMENLTLGSTSNVSYRSDSDSGYDGSTESIASKGKKKKSLTRRVRSWIKKRAGRGNKIAPGQAVNISSPRREGSIERNQAEQFIRPLTSRPLPETPTETSTSETVGRSTFHVPSTDEGISSQGSVNPRRSNSSFEAESVNPLYESLEDIYDHLNPRAESINSSYNPQGNEDIYDHLNPRAESNSQGNEDIYDHPRPISESDMGNSIESIYNSPRSTLELDKENSAEDVYDTSDTLELDEDAFKEGSDVVWNKAYEVPETKL